ncbi:MAG TPA: STAS domain-containing protein [Roseiflexaceae bacterium]|nr:STAS domain-containing protein [Roseiflexaceae bacterium]
MDQNPLPVPDGSAVYADAPAVPLDRSFCDQLAELVLCCDARGLVAYANPAALRCGAPPEGQPLLDLITAEAAPKAALFLEEAHRSGAPGLVWELPLRHDHGQTVGRFRGYHREGFTVVLGEIDPPHLAALQRELLDLNSDLVESQRSQQRQNRALKQALDRQENLLHTIQELTAPAVPIWDGVLLLPVVGHLDSHRAHRITEQLLQRVSAGRVRFVILDVSGIAAIDTAVAHHLLAAARALVLLGAQPVLVGVSPEIAQTVVQLGLQMNGFVVQSDVQHAISHVLRQIGGS